MSGQSYRLNQRTVSIAIMDKQRILSTIPRNAIVTVGGVLQGTHLVNVIWEGKMMMLYTRDLEERGTLVDVAVAPAESRVMPITRHYHAVKHTRFQLPS